MEERRLTASRRPGNGGKFAALELQVHPPQGVYHLIIESIVLYHILRFYYCHTALHLTLYYISSTIVVELIQCVKRKIEKFLGFSAFRLEVAVSENGG
jgi:hypothetical protein